MAKLNAGELQQREQFLQWVEREMHYRGINRSALADIGGVSPSLVSMTLDRQLKTVYGPKFVRAVAIAFHLPEASVFERAGLISGPAEETGPTGIIAESAKDLTQDEQKKTLEYIEFLKLQRAEKEQKKNDLAGRINNLSASKRSKILNAGLVLSAAQQTPATSPIDDQPRPILLDS